MTTKKMMISNNNKKYSLPPRPQSNFSSSGLAGGDEPSASSNSSYEDGANFVPQAYHLPQKDTEDAQRFNRHVSMDSNAFENVDFSSQFRDFAAGVDGVVADDMEQLFCSDLFTEEVAAATAAAREAVSSTEPSPHTVELMSPTAERKLSEGGEGSSMASSLPSQRSTAGLQGFHHDVTVGMNYGSSAEVTAGSSMSSPYAYDASKGSKFNSHFPAFDQCPPQGYGGVNTNNNASVPSTIAVPQALPSQQMTYDSMTDPTAAAVAASARFFLHNNFNHEPSLQFCHPLAKEAQFSTGAGVASNFYSPQPSRHTCAKCHFPGSDIKIKNCPNGCTYHARCLDLVSLCNLKSNVNNAPTHLVHNNESRMGPTSLSRGVTPPTSMPFVQNGGSDAQGVLNHCPCCFSAGTTGIEILPLDFEELDMVQREVAEEIEAKQRR